MVDLSLPETFTAETFLGGLNVILRVPSLFIAETLYNTDPAHLTVPKFTDKYEACIVKNALQSLLSHEFMLYISFYVVILFGLAIAALPLRKLISLYAYILSGALIASAHYWSTLYLVEEKAAGYKGSALGHYESLERAVIQIASLYIISHLVSFLSNAGTVLGMSTMMYALPVFARLFGYTATNLQEIHNFSCVFQLIVVFSVFLHDIIPNTLDFIISPFTAIQANSWIQILMWFDWVQVFLPMQLLIFWVSLAGFRLYKYFDVQGYPDKLDGWILGIHQSTTESIVSPLTLIAAAVTITYMALTIMTATSFFLKGRTALNEQEIFLNSGGIQGLMFYLFALQTDLMNIKVTEPEKSLLIKKGLCVALSSVTQSLCIITKPVLVNLSSTLSKNLLKHIRGLLFAIFVICASLYVGNFVYKTFELDFWSLLAISYLCIFTAVEMSCALLMYGFVILEGLRTEPWQSLDSMIYYVKAITKVIEFITIAGLIGYGVHELLFSDWSWVNATLHIIHTLAAWELLDTTLKSHLLRREAVKKVESLKEATSEELQELNDVCSICHQSMHSAKITACHHFFHSMCLRKWLEAHEKCPFCSQPIKFAGSRDDENLDEYRRAMNDIDARHRNRSYSFRI